MVMSDASDTMVRLSERVRSALSGGLPVVTLETTVIAHGLPSPVNLETAKACEDAVQQLGALPGTIGVVDGVPAIGLSEDELTCFAKTKSPDGDHIEKVSLNNLAVFARNHKWAATTVAGSLRVASL